MIPTIFIVGEGVGEEQGRPMTFFGNLMRIVTEQRRTRKVWGKHVQKQSVNLRGQPKSLNRLHWKAGPGSSCGKKGTSPAGEAGPCGGNDSGTAYSSSSCRNSGSSCSDSRWVIRMFSAEITVLCRDSGRSLRTASNWLWMITSITRGA